MNCYGIVSWFDNDSGPNYEDEEPLSKWIPTEEFSIMMFDWDPLLKLIPSKSYFMTWLFIGCRLCFQTIQSKVSTFS